MSRRKGYYRASSFFRPARSPTAMACQRVQGTPGQYILPHTKHRAHDSSQGVSHWPLTAGCAAYSWASCRSMCGREKWTRPQLQSPAPVRVEEAQLHQFEQHFPKELFLRYLYGECTCDLKVPHHLIGNVVGNRTRPQLQSPQPPTRGA